jgi:hypothetical protein
MAKGKAKERTAKARATKQRDARRAVARSIFSEYVEGRGASGRRLTLAGVCEGYGITYRTLKNWGDEDPEIRDMHESARAVRKAEDSDGRREMVLSSFEKMLAGYFVEEEEQVWKPVLRADGTPRMKDGKPVTELDSFTRTRKYIPPNVNVLIFAMRKFNPLGVPGTVLAAVDDETKTSLTEQARAILAAALSARPAAP